MSRPSEDATLMEVARVFSQRSTCSRLKVGAIIAREGRVLATGYNGAPAGMDHCTHPCDCPHGATEEGPHAECITACSSRRPCTISVHAEVNAIAFAAKHGISINSATLYSTVAPCRACSQLIINAGVAEVVYEKAFRDMEGVELMHEAGIRCRVPIR